MKQMLAKIEGCNICEHLEDNLKDFKNFVITENDVKKHADKQLTIINPGGTARVIPSRPFWTGGFILYMSIKIASSAKNIY